ncbi:MAG: rRNA methyltransferase [Acidimicrobiaceae bacterium]|nr:rRNA methyltransferase [Acidimicrobiaceae bacterium]
MRAALDAREEFEAVFVAASATSPELSALVVDATARGVRVYSLAPEVLSRVADAVTPQPVVATVRLPVRDVSSIPAAALVLVLHDLRDPGNAGTLIRSAHAAGASGVVFTGSSVDPFNPKTLRATAGSIFRIPVAVSSLGEVTSSFRDRGAAILATVVRGGRNHRDVDFSRPSVVVIGNEADGLDAASIALCDESITIEMAGANESLNAGVAGSLIAFEALWRRQDTISPPVTPSL